MKCDPCARNRAGGRNTKAGLRIAVYRTSICCGWWRQVVAGMEVLLVTQGVTTPKAVLLLFHGCSHSAIDWWHASTNCPTCLGNPRQHHCSNS